MLQNEQTERVRPRIICHRKLLLSDVAYPRRSDPISASKSRGLQREAVDMEVMGWLQYLIRLRGVVIFRYNFAQSKLMELKKAMEAERARRENIL